MAFNHLRGGCGFFAYSWKLPAAVELFHLQLTILAFLLTIGAFLLTILASLLTVGAFFSYSGKVRLIRALRDCKQRSLTVSNKVPTVSKKASPFEGGHLTSIRGTAHESMGWIGMRWPDQEPAITFGMRLFYLQLRSFCLRFVFFTYGGGTVSKKDQNQFLDGGNRKKKRPNPIFRRGEP